jgi:hypothetical protein
MVKNMPVIVIKSLFNGKLIIFGIICVLIIVTGFTLNIKVYSQVQRLSDLSDITTNATSSSGAKVDLPLFVEDSSDTPMPVVCKIGKTNIQSSHIFPIGTTEVSCFAMDKITKKIQAKIFEVSVIEPAADTDGDGIADTNDNCPKVSNADQKDSNANGIGDACDAKAEPDTDGDGIADTNDNCPKVSNADQKDSNANGIGDACDAKAEPDTDELKLPLPLIIAAIVAIVAAGSVIGFWKLRKKPTDDSDIIDVK